MSDVKSIIDSIKIGISGGFKSDKQRLQNLLTGLIFVIFAILTIRYQIKLLSYQEWGDESETIVTAKMLAAGYSLYSEVFNHHGPLTFLPGFLMEKFGSYGVQGHRIPIAVLQHIALTAIYFSPLLKNRVIKNIYTGLAASVMLIYLPEIFGQMYKYQVMTGLLLIVILAQYTLPAIACPEKLATNKIIIGNLLIGSLPFLAITYLPISIFLFVASLRKNYFTKSFTWLAAGMGLNLLFLAYIGSILGFLAFHIYLNIEILPLYGGQDASDLLQLVNSAFRRATNDLSKFVLLAISVTAFANLASTERGLPWRSAMLGIGVGSLLIRADGFHGLPYFYASLAIPLIFFKNQIKMSYQSALIASFLSIICLIKLSLFIPEDNQKLIARQIPKTTEFSQLVQIFTSKHDRIIAYSFANFEYIVADRLPASGNFFYLPWQEKYNENPKFGIKIDACQDIKTYRPIIMHIDKLKLWDRFSWDSYAGCIQKIIDNDYKQILPGRPYYVRKDILPDDIGATTTQESYKVLPTPQLDARSPIKITMTSSHRNDQVGLKRIGVRFGTNARQNPGEAEFRLKDPDGSEFVRRFSLADLADNKYHYFDLDSKRYTSGQIVSITGGGIATWESHDEKGSVNTCVIYEYNNGKRRFTPGCPLF